MDAVSIMICLGVIAWSAHIGLGWLQVSQFNRALAALSSHGRILIGRSSGRFRPRVVLAMAVDDRGKIKGNFIIKGFTVFARPFEEPSLNQKYLSEMQPQALFPENKLLSEALSMAISNKR
ncbi:transcriptional regulator GutM [Rosenbergiella nectarea]|uniref:transcriptional regulator GutM n=1 Tax=Rosenbergiella nectarea TaxID=988801 RepID=UPI001F4EB6BA|nr:transcriptional regulator GutM [Rosenbergiella nectarea]